MKNKHERHLTRRDRDIVALVGRYRACTSSTIREGCFASESTLSNVHRVLGRLEKRGLIKRIELNSRRIVYYAMTRRGLRLLGLPGRPQSSLTEQSAPALLAISEYCVRERLLRLTSNEFHELYPELWSVNLRSSHYVLVRSDKLVKLRLLLVDRGGAPRRIRTRVLRVIAQRSDIPQFSMLMRAGRFQIVFLTGLEVQQAKIERQIERISFSNVEVKSALVPGLAELLTLRR